MTQRQTGSVSAQAVSAAVRGVRHGPMAYAAPAKNPRGTLSRLALYLAPYRAELALVALAIVVSTVLGLLGPYWMGVALDRFVARGDAAGLVRIAGLMVGAYLGSNLFQGVSGIVMTRVSQRAINRLRRDVFAHLQGLPIAFFDRRATGDLMSRLTNDVEAINDAVAQNATSLFASVLSMFGIVIAMFLLDRWLAIASLFVVPLMLGATRFIAVFTRRGFRELQREVGSLNGVMEESLSGAKIVKAFGRGASVNATFREANERVYDVSIRANTYALLLMPLTSVLGNLFVIVLASAGGMLALRDLVSVGVLATFIHYSQSFVQPLRQISNLYNLLQAALAGAERVFETLDEPTEDRDAATEPVEPAWRGEVRFDHVSFGYVPERRVLRDVSLEAKAGQMVALVGPTGAGKTTVINLLTRFYDVEEGAITIDGVDLRSIPKDALRKRLGLVLQETFLFGATVMENLRYGRLDATDEEVIAAAREADADHFIRQLPEGYETVLSERAANLSQGQRQLLAIARAILADPTILVLDEATSSVDTRTELRIQRALARLMRGRTSFVIAHRLSTIRDADQILVIDGGEVVERGTHAELCARDGVFRRLYELQFKGRAL
ncbi:MAG: ABC transporter ATP-binding protein [Polyangiaceae bacterium]